MNTQATVIQETTTGEVLLTLDQLVTIAQDVDRLAEIISIPGAGITPRDWAGTPAAWINITLYMTSSFMGLDMGGILYPQRTGGPFPTLWAIANILPALHDGGNTTFGNTPVHRWVFSRGTALSIELLVNDAGDPVSLWMNQTTSGQIVKQRIVWSSFLRNYTDSKLWDNFVPTRFFEPPVCPAPETGFALLNTTFFLYHPENNFDLAGQDVADELGDTTFLCMNALTGGAPAAADGYAWVSQWIVEHFPLIGQYQNCNGYPLRCLGVNNFFVGHEAAINLGLGTAFDRQCSNNPLVGEWYSLPAGGECQDGHRPGDGSCTWRKVQRVKTINGTCIQNGSSFRHACLQDGRAPFNTARAKFVAAFSSEEPTLGGCPELVVSSTSSQTTASPVGTTLSPPSSPTGLQFGLPAALAMAAAGAALGALGALALARLCGKSASSRRPEQVQLTA